MKALNKISLYTCYRHVATANKNEKQAPGANLQELIT